jgi:hypothetical protein
VLRRWHQPAEGSLPGRTSLASLFRLLTRKNVLTPAATVMVRRNALAAVGGFRQTAGALYVDLPTWLEIAATVDGDAHYLPECLAYYRVHEQQTSAQRDYQMRFQHYDVVSDLLARLPPARLEQLGWSAAEQRAALASAALTRGVASLRAQQRRAAFGHFRTVMGSTRVPRERLGALLGMLSAASGIDFIRVAERAEQKLTARGAHALR